MKVGLEENEGYTFCIEPETAIDKCAIGYLSNRPCNQTRVFIPQLGYFFRSPEDAVALAKAQLIRESNERKEVK